MTGVEAAAQSEEAAEQAAGLIAIGLTDW